MLNGCLLPEWHSSHASFFVMTDTRWTRKIKQQNFTVFERLVSLESRAYRRIIEPSKEIKRSEQTFRQRDIYMKIAFAGRAVQADVRGV